MGVVERKGRQRADREHRIIAAARQIAEREGLADEIEYSQPVLYSHFQNKEAIVAAVAVEGFAELASELEAAAALGAPEREMLQAVATAYLAFALTNVALYEAMFMLPTSLRFAEPGTRPELKAAFAAMAAAVAPVCTDVEIATEAFWASLHGLAELERSGRIRRDMRAERIALIARGLV